MTGYNSPENSIEALQAGAFWYLEKPFEHDRLDVIRQLVAQAIEHGRLKTENRHLQRQLRSRHKFDSIIGKSAALQKVLGLVEKVASTESTVLITGESGTGKELIARAVHYNSPRANRMLVTVNCGAIPGELLESELFGHVRGAFTSAITNRDGRFTIADGGTIFLDEIGDMSPDLQVKLLRLLQDGTFEPVGSSKTVAVDVRVVAATNQDLDAAIAEKRFREDLYYRLNVLHIELPPLRRRREDIPLLVEAFIEDATRRHDRSFEGISPEAMEILQAYYWPGNIRELQNLVESMVVLAPGRVVLPKDIPSGVRGETTAGGALIPVGLGSAQAMEPSTDPAYRPELEFVFRTLVDLRMDVDDLRQEFDSYRDGGPTGTSPVASFPSEPGKVEISVRQPVGRMQEGSWEAGEHVESVEVEEVGRPVVYRSGSTMEDMEREVIAAALEEVQGNRRKAAQMLAIGERTLYRKIKKFGLDEETE